MFMNALFFVMMRMLEYIFVDRALQKIAMKKLLFKCLFHPLLSSIEQIIMFPPFYLTVGHAVKCFINVEFILFLSKVTLVSLPSFEKRDLEMPIHKSFPN